MHPKQAAALRAVEEVRDGMLVGLGTGSTAAFFIEGLGARVREGLRVTAVATSVASGTQATGLGIEVLEQVDRELDLTVDGADEIDPALNLVKGRGGAFVREKIVAVASARMVVIATADKVVDTLGVGPLPVEVLPLLSERTVAQIGALGLEAVVRDGYRSDNGNLVFDCRFTPGRDLGALAMGLDAIPGVVGHGLFLGIAAAAFVADESGKVRELRPSPTRAS